jgi:hypothetical protein
MYKVRPSQLIGIEEVYDAYCFDEACVYIINQIDNKKVPHFPEDVKENPLLKKLEAGTF